MFEAGTGISKQCSNKDLTAKTCTDVSVLYFLLTSTQLYKSLLLRPQDVAGQQ